MNTPNEYRHDEFHPRSADEDFGPDPSAGRRIYHFPADPPSAGPVVPLFPGATEFGMIPRGILGTEPDVGPCDCPIHAGPVDVGVPPGFDLGEAADAIGRDTGGPVPAPPARKMWLRMADGKMVPLEEITLDGISYTGADDDEPVDVLDGAPIVPSGDDESPFYRSPEFLQRLGESILDAEDGDGPLTRAVEAFADPHALDDIEPPTYSAEDGVRAHPEFLERLRNLPRTISLKPIPFRRPAISSLLYGLFLSDRWNVQVRRDGDGVDYVVRKGARDDMAFEDLGEAVDYAVEMAEFDRDYRRLSG